MTMKFGIIKSFALLGLLALALPLNAAAADQNAGDWNKPTWAYESPDWWQAYGAKPGQTSSQADLERADGAHFQYWLQHHRVTPDERNYQWHGTCGQDGENCRPNPYSFGTNFTPPDSIYFRQYNPSYGYMMPWSFYVQPYR